MNSTSLADLHSEVRYVHTTTSTQSLVRELWMHGDLTSCGSAVVTGEQTAGRGRLGRRWEAPQGTSLLASVLCSLPDTPSVSRHLGWLTMCASMSARTAIHHVLSAVADADNLDTRLLLKWPNDIVIAQNADRNIPYVSPHFSPSAAPVCSPSPLRKVCGVLGEYLGRREGHIWTALGVGINVWQNQHQLATPAATSLVLDYPDLAKRYSRTEALDLLLSTYRTSLRHLSEELADDPDQAIPQLASRAGFHLAQPTCAIRSDGSLEITYGEHKHRYHPNDVALAAAEEISEEQHLANNRLSHSIGMATHRSVQRTYSKRNKQSNQQKMHI